MNIEDRARSYGVQIDGPIDSEMMTAQREAVSRDGQVQVDWTDKDLLRVTCLRLIGACGEYPWWDVSFCYGVLKDGTQVRVNVPFGGAYSLGRYTWKRDIVKAAIADGVYAKGLGILENVSQLHG